MTKEKEETIEQWFGQEFTYLVDFDEAIIGVDENSSRTIYSTHKIVNILLQNKEMTILDAIEFFEYNIQCAYIGESTPIFCNDLMFLSE